MHLLYKLHIQNLMRSRLASLVDEKRGSHENEARVSFVGRAHVTATNFAFFAGWRYMEKLQDPGLSVPGIRSFIRK